MNTAELKVVEDARRAARSQFSYYHQVMAASNLKPQQGVKTAPQRKEATSSMRAKK